MLCKAAMPPHLSSELCFAKRSATAVSFFAVHWSKHFATQNGLLSKFCYAKPPIQNFALQSALRPPHHGHDFRKRKLPLATAPSCAVSRSKHFASQNGLLSKFCYAKPPTASAVFAVFDRPVFLRGAYFAVHKRLDLNFEQPYCQYFAI